MKQLHENLQFLPGLLKLLIVLAVSVLPLLLFGGLEPLAEGHDSSDTWAAITSGVLFFTSITYFKAFRGIKQFLNYQKGEIAASFRDIILVVPMWRNLWKYQATVGKIVAIVATIVLLVLFIQTEYGWWELLYLIFYWFFLHIGYSDVGYKQWKLANPDKVQALKILNTCTDCN